MILLAWLLHAFYSAAIAYGLASIFGGLSLWIAAVSLILGSWLGRLHARRFMGTHPEFKWRDFSPGGAGTIEVVLFTFILYAGLRHFIWMFYQVDQGYSTLTAFNFGDLPLHINYIRQLANGVAFPPHNPEFASQILHYPFGPDLYNALWELVGVRLQTHLALVGIISLVTTMIFLRSFAGWWGVGGFFLSGGFAGWTILASAPLANYHQNVDWKNIFLAVFITQRGMLFAVPASLFLLQCTIDHFSGKHKLFKKQMTVVGLIWAILPLFHLHAFVIVSLMMGGYALALRGLPGLRELLLSRMAMIAYIPAAYQVLASTEWLKKASVVSLSWGWMAPTGQFFDFVVLNFGFWLLLPFMIAAAIFVYEKKHGRRRALWIEFAIQLGLFALFFNVMLAPWAWDNIKLLIWPYLGLTRLAWIVCDPICEKFAPNFSRAAIAFGLFFSGFAVMLWSVHSPTATAAQIYRTSELASTKGALADVDMKKTFAAATTHDHVLTYFGGVRVAGYEGHIWSHGINPGDTIKQLGTLMRGEGDWKKTAEALHADYIFWGPQESALYGTDEKPWMSVLKNISRVPDHRVYVVKDVAP